MTNPFRIVIDDSLPEGTALFLGELSEAEKHEFGMKASWQNWGPQKLKEKILKRLAKTRRLVILEGINHG